ncbi:UNKNOWN [Stylonychia lemnae]|uniref:Uncharacterized protein n=1 Tax=Stylonychia lemnae TaxID=5949 RepID=A0A078AWH6_STYLE|nr:UNKNOWN [Stylonychia lemnae]|eukprot:CDW86396.1 UNKNOWN [Stylonychia lemnae]
MGGNEKFQRFIQFYKLEDFEPRQRYQTIAAQYYRMKLKCLSNFQTPEFEAPSIEEGQKMIDGDEGWVMVKTKDGQIIKTEDFVGDIMFQDDDDDDYDRYVKNLSQSQAHSQKKNFREEVKDIWGKASEFGKKQSQKLKSKIQDSKNKDKVKENVDEKIKVNILKQSFLNVNQNSEGKTDGVKKFTSKIKLGISNLFKKKPKNIQYEHDEPMHDELDADANPYIRSIARNPEVEDIKLFDDIRDNEDPYSTNSNQIEQELMKEIMFDKSDPSNHRNLTKSEIIEDSEKSKTITQFLPEQLQNQDALLEIEQEKNLAEKLNLEEASSAIQNLALELQYKQQEQENVQQDEEEAFDIDEADQKILIDFDDVRKKEQEQEEELKQSKLIESNDQVQYPVQDDPYQQ